MASPECTITPKIFLGAEEYFIDLFSLRLESAASPI